jgi:S1-C subfamily serine protease
MASLRRRRHARVAFAAVLAGTLSGVAACGSGRAAPTSNAGLQFDFLSAIHKALPSVVEIDAGDSTGSGVVFDTKGDIVTNAHVIGTAKQFDVRMSASSTPMPARLVGMFAAGDLAVIRVTKGTKNLVPAHWADSATAQVGDIVLAMGAPYGLIDSVTQGIVSATERTVAGPAIRGQPPAAIFDAIQTSAPINPGNSGGALVLLNGRVLGIPTLSAVNPQIGDSARDVGFAIPANTVRLIARQLIKSGRMIQTDRASLQMVDQTHTNTTGAANGVTIRATQPGGAAANAGIRPGDVIVGIQGKQTQTVAKLDAMLAGEQPGQKVTVELLRGGNPRQITVRLGSAPM